MASKDPHVVRTQGKQIQHEARETRDSFSASLFPVTGENRPDPKPVSHKRDSASQLRLATRPARLPRNFRPLPSSHSCSRSAFR